MEALDISRHGISGTSMGASSHQERVRCNLHVDTDAVISGCSIRELVCSEPRVSSHAAVNAGRLVLGYCIAKGSNSASLISNLNMTITNK